jgi:hypothetical protein
MEKTHSDKPDELTENRESGGTKTRTAAAKSRSGKRRRPVRADAGRYLIARLLGLVCLVLVVFEGNVIYRLFTHRVGTSVEIMNSAGNAQTEGLLQDSAGSDVAHSTRGSTPSSGGNASVVALAGGIVEDDDAQAVSVPSALPVQTQNSESIDDQKVLKARDQGVDDSFFNNAVFIGDSRMEGFRNSSGITQGTFLTGIGLAINDMDKQIIQTAEGNISVYQGLSGHQYDRIYLMLGANDLGYYPWEDFLPTFKSVLEEFHQLQPQAIIYVCSVIYVDESKIAAGFEYDNNENVRTINGYILEACDELWYSYYLNLNEIFSDGTGSLISDASPDGIHLYADYLAMMLDYLKTHYLTDEEFSAKIANHPDDIANTASQAVSETENSLIEDADNSDSDSGEDNSVSAS